MFGCGLRRSEAAAVRFEDFDAATGALRIIGKGNRMSASVYATNCGRSALDAWIAIRGAAPGPMLSPVSKSGTIAAGASMTPHRAHEAVAAPLPSAAAIKACTPHDLRRSFVSSALESGADLAMVQSLSRPRHARPPRRAMTGVPKPRSWYPPPSLVHVPYFERALPVNGRERAMHHHHYGRDTMIEFEYRTERTP